MSTQIEPTDEKTAVDFIEPLTECSHYRAASISLMRAVCELLAGMEEGGRDAVGPTRQACLSSFDFLMTLASYLQKAANFRMACHASRIAMGIGDGRSEAAIASEMGVTRSMLSLEVTTFAKLAGLPPSTAMRSKEAVKVYAERQTGVKPKGRK